MTHGGAWKIAYADFVTAMMAFFLLMWLLSSVSKGELEGISQYFKNPSQVAMTGGSSRGSSASILDKGGKDLTRKKGQSSKAETMKKEEKRDIKQLKEIVEKAEIENLKSLKRKLESDIEANETLKKFKNQLLLDITSDGLRIQIIDAQNRPMFLLSSDELQPYAKVILKEIGKTLNDVPNRIGLSGHTDALPYPNGDKSFSNWELSSLRANASRRELILGGMDEKKVLRVVGLGSAVLFDKKDPLNPSNRRINIIAMNKSAEEKVISDDSPTTSDIKEEDPPALKELAPSIKGSK